MIKLLVLTLLSLKVDTLMIPWGHGEGELGLHVEYLEDAGPNYGPDAFDVENSKIAFLDTYNKRISLFSSEGVPIKSYGFDGFFTKICLWHGKIILSADHSGVLEFAVLENSKTNFRVEPEERVIRNSLEFFKDYRNDKLYIVYRALMGYTVTPFYSVFERVPGKFKEGEPWESESRYTVLSYDSEGNKILVRFDGNFYIFRRGEEVFRWNPVFYAQISGAPYRIDRDGTLYIVNYKEEGVEILEVKW